MIIKIKKLLMSHILIGLTEELVHKIRSRNV